MGGDGAREGYVNVQAVCFLGPPDTTIVHTTNQLLKVASVPTSLKSRHSAGTVGTEPAQQSKNRLISATLLYKNFLAGGNPRFCADSALVVPALFSGVAQRKCFKTRHWVPLSQRCHHFFSLNKKNREYRKGVREHGAEHGGAGKLPDAQNAGTCWHSAHGS